MSGPRHRCPQRSVPSHDLAQSLTKRVDSQRTAQSDIRGPIVDNASSNELLVQPDPVFGLPSWRWNVGSGLTLDVPAGVVSVIALLRDPLTS